MALRDYLPIADWLPNYDRRFFRPDVVAAITVWAIVVPESMAYASIAGMPPETGLYAATLPLVAYIVFGSSKRMTVGPSSAVAAVSAATIFPLAGGDPAQFIQLTVLLAFMAGVLLVIGGLLKFGAVARFPSGPVLTGFLVGVALDIAIGQSDKLFGVEVEGEGFFSELWSLLTQLSDADLLTLAVGFGSLAVLWASHRILPRVPGPLLVVLGAIGLTTVLGLEDLGLLVAGEIPSGFPAFGLPEVGAGDVAILVPGAAAIALVAFGESIAVGQAFGKPHGEEVDPDQEMLAIGASNIAGGLTGAFITNGSTSRTAAADASGQRSQMGGVAVVALLVVTMLFLTPLFHNLPEATLGAIVIHAVWHLIRGDEFRRLRRINNADFWAATGTLLGVLTIDVLAGPVIGIAISLGALMARAISPNTARLGLDPQARTYLSLADHPDLSPPPGITVIRFDAPLFFANVDTLRTEVEEAVSEPGVSAVIIDCRGVTDIDTTALNGLTDLRQELEQQGVILGFAQVRDHLLPLIESYDPQAVDRIFSSVRMAVESVRSQEKDDSTNGSSLQ